MCESETLRAQNADLSLELANEVAEVHRLRAKLETIAAAVRDLHWMARRYADNRTSYAPHMFNDHTRACMAAGVEFRDGALFARDGMGRSLDHLTGDQVAAAEEDMPHGLGLAKIRDEEMAELREKLTAAEASIARARKGLESAHAAASAWRSRALTLERRKR
jgi:hypothetical protein